MSDNVFMLYFFVLCMSIQFCAGGLCTGTCNCSNYTMVCRHGEIPTHIPPSISELFIEQIDLSQFHGNQFENVSNIQKLDIQADHGRYVPSKIFDKFTNLTYLRLYGNEMQFISRDAFLGLNNLLTLNLSSNPILTINVISRAINSENRGQNTKVLPSLLSLSLAKLQMAFSFRPVDLNGYFVKSISFGRKLKYLDISELNIFTLDFNNFGELCKSVDYVDIRKSVIGSAVNFNVARPCKSLKTIDASGIVVPVLRSKFSLQTLHFFCESLVFYTYVETLLANNINTEHDIEITDYSLDMSTCPLHFQKVSLAGMKIRWINMTVTLHETTKNSFSELNLSDNKLEYVSPLVLLPSVNIRLLDLSNNKLNAMQENYTKEFERLLWAQSKLRFLYLSHNSLTRIPMQMFKKSRSLEILDISYNKINSLGFSIKQLVNLEKLIASHNKIHVIEHSVRMELQILRQNSPHKPADGYAKKYFHVYLDANEFQCTCDSGNKQFIEWLHYTKAIDEKETITCMLHENIVMVRDTVLNEIEHFCRLQTMKKIAMISTPIVFAVVILGIFAAIRIRKHRINKLRLRKVIAQIKMGTFPLPYLAFLSYCSEDTDLVLKEIYPQLCKHLSEMTNSNEPLVCIGDKHFRPGFSLFSEVMRCVEESSVFIAIISKSFCLKKMCILEMKEAYEQDKAIIMLMVEYVDKQLMDHFLQKTFDRFVHATWIPDENGGHIEPEWKIFCRSIMQLLGKELDKDVENFV